MSGMVGTRDYSLTVTCPAGYVKGRAVTLTKSTMTVVYTTAAAAFTYLTVGAASKQRRSATGTITYSIEIVSKASIAGAPAIELDATVAKGADLEIIGTAADAGRFQTKSGGLSSGLFAAGIGGQGDTIAGFIEL